VAAAFLVGRAAHATDTTINACFKPSNGTLYLLDGGSGRHECQPGDIPISWNSSGVNGQDGVSVTSQVLAPGDDAACPNGGSKFTAANGVSYACNGTNGVDGQDGQNGADGQNGVDGQDGADGRDGVDGQDGEDFAGTFTSPNGRFRLVVDDTSARLEDLNAANGQFKLIVDDTTARLEGPSGRVRVTTGGVQIDAPNAVQIQTSGLFSASGSVTTIGGNQILLNGSGCGLLRPTDVNPFIPPTTGGFTLLNPNGSSTVRTTCQ
jgi:hypothetical protein